MVVRNLFLSEKDSEKNFLMRNERVYNVLTGLFPAVSLQIITDISEICKSKHLLVGPFRVVRGETKRAKPKIVDQAARILKENMEYELSYRAYQRYLELMTSFRILRKMPTEYVFHSYGLPLSFLISAIKRPYPQHVSWRCYFIDRLLFEDADFIVNMLKVYYESPSEIKKLTIFGISKMIHDMIFEQLGKRKREIPIMFREEIERKMRDHEKTHKNKEKVRRTEVDYSVRRDWLKELGLIEMKDKEVALTPTGSVLYEKIADMSLNLDFFDSKIFSVLKEVFQMEDLSKEEKIPILETTFNKIKSEAKLKIVETLVLINTAILLNIPRFIGDREMLLKELQKSVMNSSTKLILQSGYRTKNYYVKARS